MKLKAIQNWVPDARYYDFGRPFPSRHAVSLLVGCNKTLNYARNKNGVSCYEPGAGTGRIIAPLAEALVDWKFLGSDLSDSMLNELNFKRVCQSLSNISGIVENASDFIPYPKSNILIISSLLHSVKDWTGLMDHLISRTLTEDGIICLIGERGDIYDLALARSVDSPDPILSLFWDRYLNARKMVGAPDTEESQIGCKWEVENTEPAEYLKTHGFFEIESNTVSWNHRFLIGDLLSIVEKRCYSSMFTMSDDIYADLTQRMYSSYSSDEYAQPILSRHQAKIRCFSISHNEFQGLIQ